MSLPLTLLAATLLAGSPPAHEGALATTVPPASAEVQRFDGSPVAALERGMESRVLLLPGAGVLPSSVELHRAAATVEAPAALQAGNRRGVPYMASGAALLVAGLLIGGEVGTLVALGGALIGAYGVFLYF